MPQMLGDAPDQPPLPYLLTKLLLAAEPLLGREPGIEQPSGFDWVRGDFRDDLYGDYIYLRIGYDLIAVAVALLGGVLAWIAFARLSAGSEPEPPPVPPSRALGSSRRSSAGSFSC